MSSSAPLDIPTSSYLYAPSSNTHCAFPSWPRRDSLSESDSAPGQMRATSFLSDDDLMDPFEDDASSISSGSSSGSSPLQHAPMTDEQILNIQREREAMQREVARFILSEKERRKQAAKEKKRRGSNKKSPRTKLAAMTPIAEGTE